MRPTRIAWLLLLPAAIARRALTVGARTGFRLRSSAACFLVGGFAAMTWGIATRWQIAGRIPASNMYESMLFLGWGVGLFGVVALALRQRLLIANAAGLGRPRDAARRPPADRSLHPPDGARPLGHAMARDPRADHHGQLLGPRDRDVPRAHRRSASRSSRPHRRDLAARWSELLYWYLHVGSILLIAGILTGSIWAASSWGRYWGWDPKEVWSLVAFLAYMAILHARFDGQIRAFGVALSSIAAFWTILMTYLGVNFVLASGLHSYGFGARTSCASRRRSQSSKWDLPRRGVEGHRRREERV